VGTSQLRKLALLYLVLLCLVLGGLDISISRTLRQQDIRTTFQELGSVARILENDLPSLETSDSLVSWTDRVGRSGLGVSVFSSNNDILAEFPARPPGSPARLFHPEVQAAFALGRGESVRAETGEFPERAYLAVRTTDSGGRMVVMRLSAPLEPSGTPMGTIRLWLWGGGLSLFAAGGVVLARRFRAFTQRLERVKQFSRQMAQGGSAPLALEPVADELAEVGQALHEAATQHNEAVRQLTEERNRSDAILRSMVEGVAVVDENEKIVFCNEAFCSSMGLERLPCAGRLLIEVSRQSGLLRVVQQVLAERQTVSAEIEIATRSPRTFAVTATPVHTAGAAGAVLVLHDVSEIRRLERVRRDFVANVSHEFKTPLTAIQGFAETLLGGALRDKQNSLRFLKIIRDHALRMGRLTEDLLKLSLIEAGKLELNLQPVSVSEVVEPCVEIVRPKAEQKDLTLVTECPPDLRVLGDANRLREVVQNLLDNAVQYTPNGGCIRVHAVSDNGAVVVAVSDTGVGIPQSDRERIFERFYRVDNARSREVGGTGLGLAIAKHLVEAHNGEIEVVSEIDHGSTFSVHLPSA